MKLRRHSSGECLRIHPKPLASGGEGSIHGTDDPEWVAKLHHRPSPALTRKLTAMIANPPADLMSACGHVSIAWPVDLLVADSGQVAGFLMPRIGRAEPLHRLCIPKTRLRIAPGFDWKYAHTAAMNLASAVGSVHRAGHVIGDMKTVNILVNDRALVSLVDTDSFQVTDPKSGRVFACPVGSEGFTAPELLGGNGGGRLNEFHDRFALGVCLFYLLFGTHPFQGRWEGRGMPKTVDENIGRGDWIFGRGSNVRPHEGAIRFTSVHPAVRDAFARCFSLGYRQSAMRPPAADWIRVLRTAVRDLGRCDRGHVRARSGDSCPSCAREESPVWNKLVQSSNLRRLPNRCAACGMFMAAEDGETCRQCGVRLHLECLKSRQTVTGFLSRRDTLNCPRCDGELSGSIRRGIFPSALFQ